MSKKSIKPNERRQTARHKSENTIFTRQDDEIEFIIDTLKRRPKVNMKTAFLVAEENRDIEQLRTLLQANTPGMVTTPDQEEYPLPYTKTSRWIYKMTTAQRKNYRSAKIVTEDNPHNYGTIAI